MHYKFLSNQQARLQRSFALGGDSLLVTAESCLPAITEKVLAEREVRFQAQNHEQNRNRRERSRLDDEFLERYNREREILARAGEDPDKATGKLELQIAYMMELQATGVIFSSKPSGPHEPRHGLYLL